MSNTGLKIGIGFVVFLIIAAGIGVGVYFIVKLGKCNDKDDPCIGGKVCESGKCVANKCKGTDKPVYFGGDCFKCTPYNTSACKTGQVCINNECAAEPSCPSGYKYNNSNNKCTKSCTCANGDVSCTNSVCGTGNLCTAGFCAGDANSKAVGSS